MMNDDAAPAERGCWIVAVGIAELVVVDQAARVTPDPDPEPVNAPMVPP